MSDEVRRPQSAPVAVVAARAEGAEGVDLAEEGGGAPLRAVAPLPLRVRNLGQSGRIVPEKTLSLYALLFDGQGEEAARAFIKDTIGPLLDHDRRRKAQLASTLYAYFETGRSLQRAADALGIHVNTMRQRLDSIGTLCPDWAEPNRGLELHMALRLLRLSETLPS